MSHNYFLKGQQFAQSILNENINTSDIINREFTKGLTDQNSWVNRPLSSNSAKRSPNTAKPIPNPANQKFVHQHDSITPIKTKPDLRYKFFNNKSNIKPN